MKSSGIHFSAVGRLKVGRRIWEIGTAPLKRHGLRGMVLTPKRRGVPAAITISTHLRRGGKMYREAIIHEVLHAAFPEASESHVRCTAHSVAEALRGMRA